MKTIKQLTIILTSLITLNGYAQEKIFKVGIISKTKSYSVYKANQVIIMIVKIGDKKSNNTINYTTKTGRFSRELELNQNYLVYVHKEGYETLALEVSTVGANPEYKYLFVFDMIFGFKVIKQQKFS